MMESDYQISVESTKNSIKHYHNYDNHLDENKRNFKSLLNKYQLLVEDYHKQATESKSSIGILVERVEKLNNENTNLIRENEYLKKRINYMANRMDSLECMAFDTRCIRACKGKHIEYEKYDYRTPYPNFD